eukprot:TRINITY_DN73012_c0_g1_i1.p1 TRINITY_DN73012_c0_g1~~TRINITY_DN73012_c0_g1_i1.p1  ORF type:complete len:212 (-),score=20.31 TRINITY_DN73012_c0_g1_i1:93-728(-)
MGISRDRRHKRRRTGAKVAQFCKKRKHELGRQPSKTKLAAPRIYTSRVRGGRIKYRAMRLNTGHYSWSSEGQCFKTRILDTAYHASNNELVRTKCLTKGAVVYIDATPFKEWYEKFYGVPLGIKKGKKVTKEETVQSPAEGQEVEISEEVKKEQEKNLPFAPVEQHLQDAFGSGRILAKIQTRPGQIGRADGYILEGRELDFYLKKLAKKK